MGGGRIIGTESSPSTTVSTLDNTSFTREPAPSWGFWGNGNMASSPLESQWLAQLAAMRAALADINLPSQQNGHNAASKQYGLDILANDEDLSSASGDSDLWDYISDEPDDDGEDREDGYDIGDTGGGVVYGAEWLRGKCEEFAERKAGLGAGELEEQILASLIDGDGVFP